MKTVSVQKRKIDLKALRMTAVPEIPPDAFIVKDRPTIVTHNGVTIAGYYDVPRKTSQLRTILKRIKYAKTERTGGLPTRSRIFGCSPRVAIRKDFCSKCELAYEDPEADFVLKSFGIDVEKLYLETNAQVFDAHVEKVSQILPEWKMPGSIWTQGIVNWNNQLRYHLDQGNFKETWNAMLTFKKDIEGGYLYMPEFNLAFEVADGTVSLFDGQAVLHGVTPIRKCSMTAYRYSIVYYSLKQMTKCVTLKEELARIKKVKTAREQKRATV